MRWIKKNHLVMLGFAAGVAWLGAAAPARANTIVRHPGYEDLSGMVPHLPTAWKATTTSVLVTDEDPITGTGPAPGTTVAANAETADPHRQCKISQPLPYLNPQAADSSSWVSPRFGSSNSAVTSGSSEPPLIR